MLGNNEKTRGHPPMITTGMVSFVGLQMGIVT